MSHVNIPERRVERLIRIHDLRAEGKRPRDIERAESISSYTLAKDLEILSAHTRAELAAMLGRRRPRPAPPQLRPCVYTQAKGGALSRCGRASRGQYCEEHQRLTRPGAGESFRVAAHVYLKASGGKRG